MCLNYTVHYNNVHITILYYVGFDCVFCFIIYIHACAHSSVLSVVKFLPYLYPWLLNYRMYIVIRITKSPPITNGTYYYSTVGSGRGLDGLGKEIPRTSPSALAAAAADDDDDEDGVHSECPELSVEEMTTTMTTDTSSSVNPHLSSTADGNSNQSRSLEITTASNSMDVTGASNSCKHIILLNYKIVLSVHSVW